MLTRKDIIRAWKDPVFRLSLNDAQRAQLPVNPAGLMELGDADLDAAGGGSVPTPCSGTCCPITQTCYCPPTFCPWGTKRVCSVC